MTDILRDQFLSNFFENTHYTQEKLLGDAGARHYIRISTTDTSYILCDAREIPETIPDFCKIQSLLHDFGLRVPTIYASSEHFMLLEDLGTENLAALYDASPEQQTEYLTGCIQALAHLHQQPLAALKGKNLPCYDVDLFKEQTQLFTDMWLPLQNYTKEEAETAKTQFAILYRKIAAEACSGTQHLLLRDFFVGNIMWMPKSEGHHRACLIDFQDAGLGPSLYDLVSLLQDARRDIPNVLHQEMLALYCSIMDISLDNQFNKQFSAIAIIRHTRILAVFIRLAAIGKEAYLSYIPRVWSQLEQALNQYSDAATSEWFDRFIPSEARNIPSLHLIHEKITVA